MIEKTAEEGVLRYPRKMPTLGQVLAPQFIGAVIGVLGLYCFAVFSPNAFQQRDADLEAPVRALFWFMCVPFVVMLLWVSIGFVNGVLRRRAWNCYIQNSRTLAICVPGRRTEYVKRKDCARAYPFRGRLVLSNGRSVSLNLLEGEMSVWEPVCKRWWPGLYEPPKTSWDLYGVWILADGALAGLIWVVLVLGIAQVKGTDPVIAGAFEPWFVPSVVLATIVAAGVILLIRMYRWSRVVEIRD